MQTKHYLLILMSIVSVSASPIYTYTYKGSNFTTASGTGGPTTADFVSVSFETMGLLPGNLIEWNGDDVTTLSWTISDGVNTFSGQTASSLGNLGVSTDASGHITNWDIEIILVTSALWIETVNPPSCCGVDQSETFGNPGMAATAFASTAIPGTWTVNPEPATWSLVALPLAGIWFWNRPRPKHSTHRML